MDSQFLRRDWAYCYPVDRVAFMDMATAISRIYIQGGFVIAADGREKQSESGVISSDREQKIFPLYHSHGVMSCAITGSARIGEKYRLSNEVPSVARTLEDCDAITVGEYADRLAHALKRSFQNRFPTLNRIVSFQLLLDGYMDGRPDRARAIVPCSRRDDPVVVESQPLSPTKSTGVGSNLIHQSLYAPELQYESLRPYWSVCQQTLRTIDQAVSVARAIIQAQCDPMVACVDSKAGDSFGGHIHVATVTPGRGFEWAVAPAGSPYN